MDEESRIIKRVGYYSTSQVDPGDCKRCHNATWGTILIDNICLDCFILKTEEAAVIERFRIMCEESLCPESFARFDIIAEEIKDARHIPPTRKICCQCLKPVGDEWCDVKCTTTGKVGIYCAECFAFFSAELESKALNKEAR